MKKDGSEEVYQQRSNFKKWINVYEVVNHDSEDPEEWEYEFVKGVQVNGRDMEEMQAKLYEEFNDCVNVVVFIENEEAESHTYKHLGI